VADPEQSARDLARHGPTWDIDCQPELVHLLAEVDRLRERIPELERENAALRCRLADPRNWSHDDRQRAERVEAAAQAVVDDHKPEPWAAKFFEQHPEESAEMRRRYELLDALRAALADAPAPEAESAAPAAYAASLSPISTRRAHDGAVHEMADLGVGTMCGRDLPEPWTYTDAPVNCRQCLARLAAPAEEVVGRG